MELSGAICVLHLEDYLHLYGVSPQIKIRLLLPLSSIHIRHHRAIKGHGAAVTLRSEPHANAVYLSPDVPLWVKGRSQHSLPELTTWWF